MYTGVNMKKEIEIIIKKNGKIVVIGEKGGQDCIDIAKKLLKDIGGEQDTIRTCYKQRKIIKQKRRESL
jgi:hypothetical protein